MKVKFTNEMKKYISIADAPKVNNIINIMKEDDASVSDYALIALHSLGYKGEILQSSAEICVDKRAYDIFFENSGYINIYIRFTAFCEDATFCDGKSMFIKCGALISDIWNYDGNERTFEESCYIQKFVEK